MRHMTAALLTCLTLLTSCASWNTPAFTPAKAVPDAEVARLMQREKVQGLALAVIDDGKVVQVAAYGHRNVQRGLKLTPDTIMYGASLTKTAFAYMLLQLVDEGRVSLDASVATLLPRPLPEYKDYKDLVGDERWRALTPRILLTHSTGFANLRWLEPDKRLRFHFDPGTRYAYSGEGFYLLQLIVEQGLGLDAGKEMQRRVFDRFGMTNTSMQWRADFQNNLADGYGVDGKMEPHDERSKVSAAGSMDTTIADQARLWAGIVRGDGLSAASRAELVRPRLPIRSRQQFPTLAPEPAAGAAATGLHAGLGLVTFADASGPAWFKGGHNDWTGNMVVCLENGRRCVVMLANDVRAERIYPELAEAALGRILLPWEWEYGPLDFAGQVRFGSSTAYSAPDVNAVFGEIEVQLRRILEFLGPQRERRLTGIGLAAPLMFGGWQQLLGMSAQDADAWTRINTRERLQAITTLPVEFAKDTAAASVAELVA